MPDWWPTVRAAKYFGIPPWELLGKSKFWTHVGNEAVTAEARADEARHDAQQASYSPTDAGVGW